jgi:hypothetical protein
MCMLRVDKNIFALLKVDTRNPIPIMLEETFRQKKPFNTADSRTVDCSAVSRRAGPQAQRP